MGYRSNIRCLIYHNGHEDAQESYDKLKLIMNTTFNEVTDAWHDCLKYVDDKRIVDFNIDNVKWYEGYKEVDEFMKMLSEMHSLGFVYEFVRVGEDDDDIERQESGLTQGHLYTATTIHAYYE